MGFGEAVKSVFSKYFQFSGRSRRSEYWYFVLFNIIAGIVLGIADLALGLRSGPQDPGVLGSLFTLATIIPGLAVGVRRLHDTNRTGWWLIAPYALLIPAAIIFFAMAAANQGAAPATMSPMLGIIAAVFGLAFVVLAILLLVWFCTKGTAGQNKYGSDPTQAEDAAQVFS